MSVNGVKALCLLFSMGDHEKFMGYCLWVLFPMGRWTPMSVDVILRLNADAIRKICYHGVEMFRTGRIL